MRNYLAIGFLLLASTAGASSWFSSNRSLSIIYPGSVWKYIEKADARDNKGDTTNADYYLRLAKKITDETKPFAAANWPKGWPKGYDALKTLKYATPDAYIMRIIGDFAYAHGRNKEAILHYQAYLEASLIPDSDYLEKLARVYEQEGMYRETLVVYADLKRNLESGNFHGTAGDPALIARKISALERRLKKARLLLLDITYRNIPDFIQKDFTDLFRQTAAGLKTTAMVPDGDYRKVLAEEALTPADLENDDDLARIAKMVNASYVVKPALALIEGNYVIQVQVFRPENKAWTENYEYKNADARYLSNLIKRFACQFEGESLPAELYLPENTVRWNYETNSDITDASISADGKRFICGCESGSVYLFTGAGALIRKQKMRERALKVAVSPDGGYFAWAALDGKVYFADGAGRILWSHSFDNAGRALAISRNGAFCVAAVNNRIWFLDRKGEVFWKYDFPNWVTALSISGDATKVAVGLENGELWNFSEEGNFLWKASVKGRVVRASFSPRGDASSAENQQGEVFIFGPDGKQLTTLIAGEEKKLAAFSKEVLYVLVGHRGKFYYFLSTDGQTLWSSQVDDKVNFLESSLDGKYSAAIKNKNIIYMSLVWK